MTLLLESALKSAMLCFLALLSVDYALAQDAIGTDTAQQTDSSQQAATQQGLETAGKAAVVVQDNKAVTTGTQKVIGEMSQTNNLEKKISKGEDLDTSKQGVEAQILGAEEIRKRNDILKQQIAKSLEQAVKTARDDEIAFVNARWEAATAGTNLGNTPAVKTARDDELAAVTARWNAIIAGARLENTKASLAEAQAAKDATDKLQATGALSDAALNAIKEGKLNVINTEKAITLLTQQKASADAKQEAAEAKANISRSAAEDAIKSYVAGNPNAQAQTADATDASSAANEKLQAAQAKANASRVNVENAIKFYVAGNLNPQAADATPPPQE